MKKVILFFAALFFWGFFFGPVYASGPYIDNDLSIHIPCALYKGNEYNITFQAVFPSTTSSDSDSSEALHWIISSIDAASSDDDCIPIDEETLKLVISNIQYMEQQFGLSLHFQTNATLGDSIYWQPAVIFETAASKKSKNSEVSDFSDETQSIVDGLNQFNIELYKKIKSEGKNLIYSPYSISTALAMAWAGAKNETAQEMKETLQWSSMEDLVIHQGFNYLDVALENRGIGAEGADGNGFRLNISNNIWGQTGFPFLPEYLDTLALHYGAQLALLDFVRAPEPSRETINAWISDQTEERINDLIPQGAIGSSTRLVLTNAIYFNAAWQSPFEKERTVENTPFHISEIETVNVAMMRQTEWFNYVETNGYQAVELPYDGGELSMVVMIPKGFNLNDFEETLSLETIDGILASMSRTSVFLEMPRFKLEPDGISLKTILQQMGMVKAFTPEADFKGIIQAADLFISDVIHKAFINVDEAGTEAAAATAVIFVETSMPPQEPVNMKIDRPFIFMIRDIETGVVLFSGKVVTP